MKLGSENSPVQPCSGHNPNYHLSIKREWAFLQGARLWHPFWCQDNPGFIHLNAWMTSEPTFHTSLKTWKDNVKGKMFPSGTEHCYDPSFPMKQLQRQAGWAGFGNTWCTKTTKCHRYLNASTYRSFIFLFNVFEKTPALITSPGAMKFNDSLDCLVRESALRDFTVLLSPGPK